jgi:hypothetical protein
VVGAHEYSNVVVEHFRPVYSNLFGHPQRDLTSAAPLFSAAPDDYRGEEDDNNEEEDDDKNRDYETENQKKQRKI